MITQQQFYSKIINQFSVSLLDSSYDGVYFVDLGRKITYWNKAAEKISGYAASEVLNRACSDNILIHVDDHGGKLCTGNCPLHRTISDKKAREAELFLHHKNGHRIPVHIRVSPILDDMGEVLGAVEMFSERTTGSGITLRLKELENLSLTDKLTGAANRSYTEYAMAERLKETAKFGWPFGIILIDLDDFIIINDKFGREAGDRVLKMIFQDITGNVRALDMAGRMDDDKFMIILRNVDSALLRAAGENLRLLIEKSVIFDDIAGTISVTASIGGTMALQTDSPEGLLGRADMLVRKCKLEGKNRFYAG